MHFAELAIRSAQYTLWALEGARKQTLAELEETGGATTVVRNLQMLQLQKAIVAVGLFSMFEASAQDALQCADGFKGATEVLTRKGLEGLRERFSNLYLAVNVLKHGRGRSYDALVEKASNLPFRVRLPGQPFFLEGDVSEPDTLVEVDDAFVMACADTILEVSSALERSCD